jgi:hypothetical protein
MTENNDTTPRKRCCSGEKCIHPDGPELPATREYFYGAKRIKSGLSSYCKKCSSSRVCEWARNNRDKNNANKQRWRANNRERYLEKSRGYTRKMIQKNPEKARRLTRDWHRAHPEKLRIYTHQRRARKRSFPDTLTVEQWQRAISYFHGCCAACGRQANDLFATHFLAMDHWIPLNSPDCPGTVVTNIIPLCNGQGGCNNSKHDKEPLEWLIWKFGKRKAKVILQRIQGYFDSLK